MCHIAGTDLAEAIHLDRTRKIQKDNKCLNLIEFMMTGFKICRNEF